MDITSRVHPEDWKYVPVEPEPGFDPRHNRRVVAEVIEAHELMQKKKREEADEGIRERADAVACYLTSQHGAHSGKPVEKYFGRKLLAYLRGKEIVSEVEKREKSRLFQGNTFYAPVNVLKGRKVSSPKTWHKNAEKK